MERRFVSFLQEAIRLKPKKLCTNTVFSEGMHYSSVIACEYLLHNQVNKLEIMRAR